MPRKLLAERRRIEQVIRAIVAGVSARGPAVLCRRGHQRAAGSAGCQRVPAHVRHLAGAGAGHHRRRPEGVVAIRRGGGGRRGAPAARAIEFRGITGRDVVVGIAASGTTPFVWGALREAKRRGATTVLVCFNPFLADSARAAADHRHRPQPRARAADRLDAAEGRDGDEAAVEHVHHPGDGAPRQGAEQPDDRSEPGECEIAGPGGADRAGR